MLLSVDDLCAKQGQFSVFGPAGLGAEAERMGTHLGGAGLF
jgi:hypothetical protein